MNNGYLNMSGEDGYEKHDKLTERTLRSTNKPKSEYEDELQQWEVQSTEDGQGSQGE